ncbi:MAG TPA: hypothetical protein VMF64_16775, partial [Steroidobacteraceae bacterium]|nr:hypothetical protein [Steroidobacteraceae bacterium]
ALGLLVSLGAQTAAHAQGRRGAEAAPQTAQAAAPVDFTGYWTSLVTDVDWLYRMVTPRPGDYENVPLNAAGIQIMDAWDPSKDTAAGEQCRSYGAPSVMQTPEHLHVSWQDPQTLEIETDAGQQTRLFHFVRSDADQRPKSLQGYSFAQWQMQRRGGNAFNPASGVAVWGNLRVMTTDLTAGYLRKNGVPYSDNARMEEYYDLMPKIGDETIMVDSATVTDPVYLTRPFVREAIFKKLPGDAGWKPTPCSATW